MAIHKSTNSRPKARKLSAEAKSIAYRIDKLPNSEQVRLAEIARKASPSVAAQPFAENSAHAAWCILDRSDTKMREALSLLMTIKIALRHPDHQLDGDVVADSLSVICDLFAEIGGGIDSARDIVRGLDLTVVQS